MSGSAESRDESVAGLTRVILITFSPIDEDNKPALYVELELIVREIELSSKCKRSLTFFIIDGSNYYFT